MGSTLVYKLIGYLNYDIWFSCHANRVIDAPGALHHIIVEGNYFVGWPTSTAICPVK